jgi:hypothetical protein
LAKKIRPRITEYMDSCIVCGMPAQWHHALHGTANRKLADEDGLIIPLCPVHHVVGKDAVHNCHTTDILCEIIGQLAFERNELADGTAKTLAQAKMDFFKRYGKGFI